MYFLLAIGIFCYKGDSIIASNEDIVDCSKVGLQREELYCRNLTEYRYENGKRVDLKVKRTCVASTW